MKDLYKLYQEENYLEFKGFVIYLNLLFFYEKFILNDEYKIIEKLKKEKPLLDNNTQDEIGSYELFYKPYQKYKKPFNSNTTILDNGTIIDLYKDEDIDLDNDLYKDILLNDSYISKSKIYKLKGSSGKGTDSENNNLDKTDPYYNTYSGYNEYSNKRKNSETSFWKDYSKEFNYENITPKQLKVDNYIVDKDLLYNDEVYNNEEGTQESSFYNQDFSDNLLTYSPSLRSYFKREKEYYVSKEASKTLISLLENLEKNRGLYLTFFNEINSFTNKLLSKNLDIEDDLLDFDIEEIRKTIQQKIDESPSKDIINKLYNDSREFYKTIFSLEREDVKNFITIINQLVDDYDLDDFVEYLKLTFKYLKELE